LRQFFTKKLKIITIMPLIKKHAPVYNLNLILYDFGLPAALPAGARRTLPVPGDMIIPPLYSLN
jgi:hypothetical protein